nr:hypothetical protein [Tanacetum cinerariifolium]
MHKAFPLPVIKFPLAEEVPIATKESSNCQKKRDATAMRIALLVIEFGDSYELPTSTASTTTTDTTSGETGKKSRRTVALTAEDMQKRKNDVKVRTTLLMSLLDEHQLRFSKSDLNTMSLDDLYNHLKVYESKVQKNSKPNSQNMAFISLAKHNRGNEDGNSASVFTASTNVPTASANIGVASISQDTACAYIASQSSGSQIKFEDINQIDEVDIEEMDIKWSMALLSMRADKFWKKTVKKISIQGSNVVGFDKSKVECFNCHKMGHFVRECRDPRSQDRGRRDNYRQGSKVKEHAPKALMEIDEVGWDKSYMANDEEDYALVADEEAPTEFALMANTSPASKTGLPEFADDTVTDYSRPSPTMESTLGDDQNRNSSVPETDASPSTITSKPFIKFVKPNDSPSKSKTGKTETLEKPPVKYAEQYRKPNKKPNVRGNKRNWNNLKSHQLGPNFVMKKKVCFNCGDSNHLAYNYRKRVKKGTSRSQNNTHESFTPRPVVHRPYRPPVKPINMNGGCNITGKGTIKTSKLEFENVYFVKDLKDFKLLDDANILLRTPGQHNMYAIDLNNIVSHKDLTCLVAKASADECMLWHRRMGHLNFKSMNKLVRHNLVRGMPTKCFENDHTCTACLKGKQYKASLTDDFSRFTWTFFLKTKDETSGILKKFITEIENLKDLKVKIIRCDNEGEFRNKKMNDFCSQKGIKRDFSNARTPQQNCVAERRNRTLIDAARIMVLVNKSHNKTPYKLFNGRSPAIGFLKPFGCHVMILNTLDNLGKFEEKGNKGYFIGYSMSSKVFRVFNKRTRRVEEYLHVELLENKANEKGCNKSRSEENVSSLRYIALPNCSHYALLESSSSKPQDHCSTEVSESNGNPNPTASTSNPLADQMEILTVESPIPTVSSPVPTAYSTDSQEPLSDARLISKRVDNQVETPSLDNILTLTNRFEDILGVTTNSDESNGVEADVSNMETTITASPTPTLRIHKDHPKIQIIDPVDTSIQTRNKSKEVGEQSFIATIHQKTDPALLQFCLFSCFLSQVKPKKIFDALQDPSWVEAMQEVLKIQIRIFQVGTATASGNSNLAVGMPCAFYSQQSSPKLDAPFAFKFSRIK